MQECDQSLLVVWAELERATEKSSFTRGYLPSAKMSLAALSRAVVMNAPVGCPAKMRVVSTQAALFASSRVTGLADH